MPRGGGFRPGGGMGMGMGDAFGGGGGQHVNNPHTQVFYDNQPKHQPQFNLGIFVIVLAYSAFLVFFTFLLILTKKRVLTYVRVPSVLYFITFYLLNLFILRGVFGYHFIYQIVTTCAMGFSFVKFKNLSVIGLTGGIGCGKSTFAKILEGKNLAAKIIDCDLISEQLKEPGGKCYNLIVQQFGRDIVDPDTFKIDKDKLRNLVFNNRALKKNLEKIMHWEIFKEIIVQIWNVFYAGVYNFAVLDAPLLYETKVLEWITHPIVVVHVSDKELWLKRIMDRDRCSKEEAILKISNQMPIETKIQMAEIKVDNLGDENSMMKQFGEQFLKFITV